MQPKFWFLTGFIFELRNSLPQSTTRNVLHVVHVSYPYVVSLPSTGVTPRSRVSTRQADSDKCWCMSDRAHQFHSRFTLSRDSFLTGAYVRANFMFAFICLAYLMYIDRWWAGPSSVARSTVPRLCRSEIHYEFCIPAEESRIRWCLHAHKVVTNTLNKKIECCSKQVKHKKGLCVNVHEGAR